MKGRSNIVLVRRAAIALCYTKGDPKSGSCLFFHVNLDPHTVQEFEFEVPLWEFGIPDDGAIEVLTAYTDFEAVKNALEAAGLKPEVAEVTMRAENTIELTGEDAARMQKLLDIIEDLDDVQEVFHNAEINE